jgi:hypothetical protein
VCALNLIQAPRTGKFRCLLSVLTYAQAMRQITLRTVTDEPPGVSDSIEPNNGHGAILACRAPLGLSSLVRFCEGMRYNWCMAEILWHRRETRRQTENTNVMPGALGVLILLDKNQNACFPQHL